jgi:PAS domain S-box-containing protein
VLREFRTLFNDAPVAYHEIDRQGIIHRVNRAECRLLERPRHELVGLPVWEIVSAQHRDEFRTLILEKMSGVRPLSSAEVGITTASGKNLIVQTYENFIYGPGGETVGLRAAMLDITDRKQHEQQAQALAVEKYAREQAEAAVAEVTSILERIGDAYIAFDTEWRYTYVNRKAAELALRPASELIGRSVWEEFPEAMSTPFFTELHRAMREQKPIEFDNYFAPLGKWFGNTVYPSPSGVSVFYRDITERIGTRKALEQNAAELARKNAELEAFASVASHDLQEPLRMIGGYATLLARRYSGQLDADADEFISYITSGVNRMQRLIKDLLRLCKLSDASAMLAEVSVSHIVDLALGNLEVLIQDSHAVIVSGELPVVRFNETQLLQVIQNLIGNALKYRGADQPRIEISAVRDREGWVISVRDNGQGFDISRADEIFKPFHRLELRDDGGTGIGLAICKKIVETRGGRIWAVSSPGAGSQFSFTIPDAVPTAG